MIQTGYAGMRGWNNNKILGFKIQDLDGSNSNSSSSSSSIMTKTVDRFLLIIGHWQTILG